MKAEIYDKNRPRSPLPFDLREDIVEQLLWPENFEEMKVYMVAKWTKQKRRLLGKSYRTLEPVEASAW